MQITVTSDDGKIVEEVYMEDLDLSGHSLNRAVLEWRLNRIINRIWHWENNKQPAPVAPS